MNMNMHGDITVQIPPGSTGFNSKLAPLSKNMSSRSDNKVVEGGMMVPGMNGMNMNEQMSKFKTSTDAFESHCFTF